MTSSTKQLITIEKIRDNVDRVRIGTKEIILVGTAHVSHESERLVQEIIQQEVPDAVAIELCESRYRSLREPERWKNMQLSTVIREGKGYILVSQLILAAFQRKLGKQLDIRPGQEMLAAAQCAEEHGHALILADREIRITFKRLWRRLTWRTSFKLLHTALSALFDDQSISKEDIERIKSEAMLEDILAQFAQEFPDIKEVLINERDRYLGSQIIESPYQKIVAALGAGHVPGVIEYLQSPRSQEDLNEIPARTLLSKSLVWLIPGFILLLFILGFLRGSGGEMVSSWLLITSLSCLIGALVARAHLLTVLASIVVAPFTTLNPFLRSGWIAALVEVSVRKPHVHDMETLLDDITSLKGWYANRVARGLLVMISVNIFGFLGSLIGLKILADLL